MTEFVSWLWRIVSTTELRAAWANRRDDSNRLVNALCWTAILWSLVVKAGLMIISGGANA